MAPPPAPPAHEVAVGAVCVRDGHLLLVRRGRGVAVGHWSLPGGRVEPGESLVQAVVREMAEETGLAVTVGAVCGVAERRWEGHHYVIIDYWVAAASGTEAVAADDAAAVMWASRSDLAHLDLVDGLLDFLAEHKVLAGLV